MSLVKKITKIKVELQNSNLKKSGKNSHAGFAYFELADFLPKLNELMLENEISDCFSINENYATLLLFDDDNNLEYTIPFKHFSTPLTNGNKPMMQDIQYLGALNTYYKRYLYMNAFGISDGEVIDALPQMENITKETALAYKLTFGKYKDKTLEEVLEEKPDYLLWLQSNSKDEIVKAMLSMILEETTDDEQTIKTSLINEVGNLSLEVENKVEGFDRVEFAKTHNYNYATASIELLETMIAELKQMI